MSMRLDVAVAERFSLSRNKAAAVIMAGRVTVDGKPARKAGQPVSPTAKIEYDAEPMPVSRAAGKLAGALDGWTIPFEGKRVLDVGASTGGFTQTVLDRGARGVFAVDVGHGQLDWSLRNDERVTNLERTDVRSLKPDSLPAQPDVAVADVSFISLTQVLPSVAKLVPASATVIALFKPQFEVGRDIASKHRGVIDDPAIVEAAFTEFADWLTKHGWTIKEWVESTVPGTKGNRERLIWLETPRQG
jgi:23S rRNA (cytidine1920-2'-O)/16S rRNA (cytidine1409-2'-O)-methyltransferase